MLLRHSVGVEPAAAAIEKAVASAIRSGARTRDIAALGARDWLGTAAFTDVVLRHLTAN
jgi:isocitrate dehydrogenase